jgi:hypothetical protein
MGENHRVSSADSQSVARAALDDIADAATVGDHQKAVPEADGILLHYFAADLPGYRGWSWVVSVTELDGTTTINDVVLLPGAEAVTAPEWTPYKERIKPGDLGPGDVLPPDEDDIRLVPAWGEGDGDTQTPDRFFAREVGLGREWVLSADGREMAAQRWNDGTSGPQAAIAQQSARACRTCGFLISLAGPLAESFGVCANGMATDDGRIVAFDHGCGAHSGARISRGARIQKLPPPVLDTVATDDF